MFLMLKGYLGQMCGLEDGGNTNKYYFNFYLRKKEVNWKHASRMVIKLV